MYSVGKGCVGVSHFIRTLIICYTGCGVYILNYIGDAVDIKCVVIYTSKYFTIFSLYFCSLPFYLRLSEAKRTWDAGDRDSCIIFFLFHWLASSFIQYSWIADANCIYGYFVNIARV